MTEIEKPAPDEELEDESTEELVVEGDEIVITTTTTETETVEVADEPDPAA